MTALDTEAPSAPAPADPGNRSRRLRAVIAALLAGALLLLGGIALGRLTSPAPSFPRDTSAEAGFLRDMRTHHDQAVQMALLIYPKTSDDDIRLLAYDIATSQSQQAGQMAGYLTAWGLTATGSEAPMTWMTRPATVSTGGHDAMTDDPAMESPMVMEVEPGGAMPGYATRDQIDALEAATGDAANRLFLELMTAHHLGGVEMADAVLARSTDELVTPLAQSVVLTQQSDIDYMAELLTRY